MLWFWQCSAWVWSGTIALAISGSFAIAPAILAQPTLPEKSLSNSTPKSTRTVSLNLQDIITLVAQSNRDLRNAQLDRIVQRQELKEAESRFDPKFIPSITVGITQNSATTGFTGVSPTLSTGTLPQNFINIGSGRTERISDRTNFNSTTQLQAQLRTRIGTQVQLTTDPLSDLPFSLRITQPLLRGFGRTVNEAPIKAARLINTKQSLDLRQTRINKITETILAYCTLYQRQESVRIQEASLASQRYQLQVTQALVQAGRRARVDLVNVQQSIADGERALIAAKNQLTLANSVLVRLIDTAEPLTIAIAPESIDTLIQMAVVRAQTLNRTALLETAYLNRPDYLQAKIDIETEKLNLVVAQDNKRWDLSLQSDTSIGAASQTAASLVLLREFGNQQLETETQRRQIGIQKNTNRLNQLTEKVQTDLDDQLNTIAATQQQIIAAQQATTLAQQQLEIAQERIRQGRDSIFEVTQKENTLREARNNELNAKLEFITAIAQLDQVLGTTLATWNFVDSTSF